MIGSDCTATSGGVGGLCCTVISVLSKCSVIEVRDGDGCVVVRCRKGVG